jgi:hypothetical protein
MNDPLVLFWSLLIFASIAWYGFLVFYIGAKGGRELWAMTRRFEKRDENKGGGGLVPGRSGQK